jgi:hypothetical protein
MLTDSLISLAIWDWILDPWNIVDENPWNLTIASNLRTKQDNSLNFGKYIEQNMLFSMNAVL